MIVVKVIFQLILNGGILLVFLFHPNIRKNLAKFPLLRVLVYTFFGMSLFAQCFTFNQHKWPQEKEWFPFTRWAMFGGSTHNADQLSIYEWQGIKADGAGVAINPSNLFLTTNAVGHFTKTKAMGNLILKSGQSLDRVDLYAKAILNAYNMQNKNDSIVALNLWCRIIDIEYGANVPEPFSTERGRIIYIYKEAL